MNWWVIFIAFGAAALLLGGLAVMAAIGAGQVSKIERDRHYLTPDEVAPMTAAQRARLLERISDGVVDDFEVYTDDLGVQHVIPVSPPRAVEDRPPPAA